LSRLEDIGREDAVDALISGSPMYRIGGDGDDDLLFAAAATSATAIATTGAAMAEGEEDGNTR
jgi:hypothetical protein